MAEALDRARFICANTAVAVPPLVPEIKLYLASEIAPLWHATEAVLARDQLPPPYWAFAWAGGQALARHILDHRELVGGRRVLDFGAGCGLVAIAAAKAGAAEAAASEIDAFAQTAIALNAGLNGVEVAIEPADVIGRDDIPWDMILCGDMCYERPLAERLIAWLRRLALRGVAVYLGDPGRAYLPKTGLEAVARYSVPTTRELEDRESREGVVWRVVGDAGAARSWGYP